MTCYHEAGHAVVSFFTSGVWPAVTTVRGTSSVSGTTDLVAEKNEPRLKNFLGFVASWMGGRVAEEIVYGHDMVSTGPSADFQMATTLLYEMFTQWGFSKKLGLMHYDRNLISEQTKREIDLEIRNYLSQAYKQAHAILHKHRKELDAVAMALHRYGTLKQDQVLYSIQKCLKDNCQQHLPPRIEAHDLPEDFISGMTPGARPAPAFKDTRIQALRKRRRVVTGRKVGRVRVVRRRA